MENMLMSTADFILIRCLTKYLTSKCSHNLPARQSPRSGHGAGDCQLGVRPTGGENPPSGSSDGVAGEAITASPAVWARHPAAGCLISGLRGKYSDSSSSRFYYLSGTLTGLLITKIIHSSSPSPPQSPPPTHCLLVDKAGSRTNI